MGIKLDWEVEAEGGWSEVGEDPAVLAARRRRNRRIRNAAIGLLIVLVLGAGLVRYRLYQIEQQLRADLETTVAAETAALRIGDREAFLSYQSPIGLWDVAQERNFEAYQALSTRLVPTGEIITLDIEADQARVILREQLDEQPYQVVWFYQRDEQGWKHIPPSPRFWGEQKQLSTTYFRFSYYEEDAELVDALAIQLTGWWEMACRATACRERPPGVEVRIEPDPLIEIGWAAYDDQTLLIPSPLLGRVPEGSPFDPALEGKLAALLAGRWADFLIGDQVPPYSEMAWLRDELRLWLNHLLDDSAPTSEFLDPLATVVGPEFVPAFLEQIKRGGDVVPVACSLTGLAPADLPVSWDGYLAYRLRAETALIADGYETEAAVLFGDPGRTLPAEVLPAIDAPTERIAKPDSIRVRGVQWVGDIAWAEVVFTPGQGGPDERVAFEPFRLLGDRWVHTDAYTSDWGVLHEEHGQHFILRVFDLDAPATTNLLPLMEQAYGQVQADLGLPPDGPSFLIAVLPTALHSAYASSLVASPAPYYMGDLIVIPSPYTVVRPADTTPEDYIRETAMRHMVDGVVTRRLAALPAAQPLVAGFAIWELERLGLSISLPDRFPSLVAFQQESGLGLPASPDDLWDREMYSFIDYVAAAALIDVIAESYGVQAIPVLIDKLPAATSMDDWLTQSLGVTTREIEAAWQVRFIEVLNQQR